MGVGLEPGKGVAGPRDGDDGARVSGIAPAALTRTLAISERQGGARAFQQGFRDKEPKAHALIFRPHFAIDAGPTRHGATRGWGLYFFDPAGNRNEVFAGLGYRVQADFPTINWTVDQLAKGIFYHARELNDAFTSVFT